MVASFTQICNYFLSRKVLGEDKLNEATLRALNEEKERQERLNNLNSIHPTFNSHPPPLPHPLKLESQSQLPVEFADFLAPAFDAILPGEHAHSSSRLSTAVPANDKPLDTSGNMSSDHSVCIIEDEECLPVRDR